MALIMCPECGKEISDKAKRCIHCGYPLNSDLKLNTQLKEKEVIINDKEEITTEIPTSIKNNIPFVEEVFNNDVIYVNQEERATKLKNKVLISKLIIATSVLIASIILIFIFVQQINSKKKTGDELRAEYEDLILSDIKINEYVDFINTNSSGLLEIYSKEQLYEAFELLKEKWDYNYNRQLSDLDYKYGLYNNSSIEYIENMVDMKSIEKMSNEEVKALFKELYSNGYVVENVGGMYIHFDNNYLVEKLKDIIPDEVNDYIALQKLSPAAFESISGTWKDIGEYIASVETYIGKYPQGKETQFLKTHYNHWLVTYLVGSVNTYPYNFETNKYNDEAIDSYNYILENYTESNISNLIREFLSALEEEQFYCSDMLYDKAKALISDYSYKDAEGYEQYVRYSDEPEINCDLSFLGPSQLVWYITDNIDKLNDETKADSMIKSLLKEQKKFVYELESGPLEKLYSTGKLQSYTLDEINSFIIAIKEDDLNINMYLLEILDAGYRIGHGFSDEYHYRILRPNMGYIYFNFNRFLSEELNEYLLIQDNYLKLLDDLALDVYKVPTLDEYISNEKRFTDLIDRINLYISKYPNSDFIDELTEVLENLNNDLFYTQEKIKYSVDNEQSTYIMDKPKAVEIVTNYLVENDEYIPEYIEVENEDDENYIVHCYDMGPDMSRTTGWYYVNKETSEVTSMFNFD